MLVLKHPHVTDNVLLYLSSMFLILSGIQMLFIDLLFHPLSTSPSFVSLIMTLSEHSLYPSVSVLDPFTDLLKRNFALFRSPLPDV